MKRHISIFLTLFLSTNLLSQNTFSSLYYGSRIKANNSSFLPILSQGEVQNNFLGFNTSSIVNYTSAFGKQDFDNFSYGLILNYKSQSKFYNFIYFWTFNLFYWCINSIGGTHCHGVCIKAVSLFNGRILARRWKTELLDFVSCFAVQ